MTAHESAHKIFAWILRKAHGRVDQETGEAIDIGSEVVALRRISDDNGRAIEHLQADLEATRVVSVALQKHNDSLTAERDEARRLAYRWRAECYAMDGIQDIADKHVFPWELGNG